MRVILIFYVVIVKTLILFSSIYRPHFYIRLVNWFHHKVRSFTWAVSSFISWRWTLGIVIKCFYYFWEPLRFFKRLFYFLKIYCWPFFIEYFQNSHIFFLNFVFLSFISIETVSTILISFIEIRTCSCFTF